MRTVRNVVVLMAVFGAVAALPGGAVAAVLSGTVSAQPLGHNPEPLAGADVTVLQTLGGETVGSILTDAEGRYSLEIPPGTYDVRFDPPSESLQSTTVKGVEVASSRVLDVFLTDKGTVRLTGTLRDAAGEPIAGSTVTLSGESLVKAKTNEEGFYSLAALPGTYRLLSGSGGAHPGIPANWSLQTEKFILKEDQERNLQLPPANSHLTVEVLGKEGEPIPGATVSPPSYVTNASAGGLGATFTSASGGQTDGAGRASFLYFDNSTPSGEGTVVPPAASGYGTTSFKAPVLEGEATVVVRYTSGGKEDTQPPQLKDLSIEPPSIDTSTDKQLVLVTATVSDDLSGFKEGAVVFVSPSQEQLVEGAFEPIGSESEGIYRSPVTFPQGAEPGDWEIANVRLRDRAGNEVSISGAEIEAAGLPHAVTVEAAQPPTVTGLSPSSGPAGGGTEVELSGTGFTGATEVRFGSAQAEFEAQSATSIRAISPVGTGTVDVTVTTPVGTSETGSADRFAYEPQVNLTSSPNPSVYGQKVTFTAQIVTEGGPAPLGTVAFTDGTATLGVANVNSKGLATFNTTQLGAGEHQIAAAYSGDANHPAGKSAPVAQVVNRANTTITLTSSLNPAPFGASGTLKASVFAVAPGGGTPAGTVAFREGETLLEVVQLSGHNASIPLKMLPVGAHEITAVYSGDPNDEPSGSEAFTQTIAKAEAETIVTSTLNPAPYGSTGTLKATIKAVAPGGGVPTGTVTFREGESVLAIVPLSSGVAKYPLGAFAPGSHAITATYNGSESYEGSAAALSQEVTKAETELTLTSSKNPAPKGSTGTIKATVKPVSPGGGTPTGTVTFREGETVLATVPLSNKVATYPLKSLAVGTHEITATYAGNTNYGASESSIVQVITP